MPRPTKQARVTRQLLTVVLDNLVSIGLGEIDTVDLLAAATALAIKSNDRAEQELLGNLMDELSKRDLQELGGVNLLSTAVSIIGKGGEISVEKEMTKKDLQASKNKPVVTTARKPRC